MTTTINNVLSIVKITTVGILSAKTLITLFTVFNSLFLKLFNTTGSFIFGYVFLIFVIIPVVFIFITISVFLILKLLFPDEINKHLLIGYVLSILTFFIFPDLLGQVGAIEIIRSLIEVGFYLILIVGITKLSKFKFFYSRENGL